MSVTHIHEIIRVQSLQRKELSPPGRRSFMATAVHSLFKLRSAVVRLNASLHTGTSSHKLRERQCFRSIKRIKDF